MTRSKGVNVETEETPEEIDEVVAVDEAEIEGPCSPPVMKLVGMAVSAILIFLAQRDLRKRPPELVRGPVVLWRVIALAPPGAVAYLLLGRRRASVEAFVEIAVPAID
jgi:hypothetical protein